MQDAQQPPLLKLFGAAAAAQLTLFPIAGLSSIWVELNLSHCSLEPALLGMPWLHAHHARSTLLLSALTNLFQLL